MEMKVFNSLTRCEEPLKPLADNTVRFYTCGPTVYNFAHIGNFRAYTFEDILRRVIQFNGMKVKQVMNLTDVDDKTIRGANAAGVPLTDYTKTYKDAFFAELTKAKKKKQLKTEDQQKAFMARYDWRRMTEQDEDLWKTILNHLKEL